MGSIQIHIARVQINDGGLTAHVIGQQLMVLNFHKLMLLFETASFTKIRILSVLWKE